MAKGKKVIHPNPVEAQPIRVKTSAMVEDLADSSKTPPSPKSSTVEEVRTQAKQFLINDNLKKALETLLQHAENQKDTDLENDCILQLSRLNGLEKRQHEGTISEETYKLEKARIRKATQDLIRKMG